jgi:hypothetical protein
MFRALGKRAIEAFLRRSMPASGGPARRTGAPLPPAAPAIPPALLRELAANRAVRVPPQAHRAPYLEDIDDWS